MENYIYLMAAIVKRAYMDLFSDNEQIKNDAIMFFEKNPFHLPDRVISESKRLYEKELKNGKQD